MAAIFDVLGYARRLMEHGVGRRRAIHHVIAAQALLAMVGVAQKRDLDRHLVAVRADMDRLRAEIDAKIERSSLRTLVQLGLGMVACFTVMTGLLALVLK
ncbi:hypothetical protein [Kaistia adipata]|uniref:hypothetical protein n=1 Tax=Kaistia adipata TaxID=166954 RepID=UPI000491C225|nr:hypothetical protein [Kaistia adipata]